MENVVIKIDPNEKLLDGDLLVYKKGCFKPVKKEVLLEDVYKKIDIIEENYKKLVEALNKKLEDQHNLIKNFVNKEN